MYNDTKLCTKTISQIFVIIRHMASPNGTTVNELAEILSLTRRSVFRLIRAMENEYCLPILSKREGFGGVTRYCLEKSFIECFSDINLPPLRLSFDEAVTIYLYAAYSSLPKECNYSNFRLLQKIFTSYKKQQVSK